MLTRFKQNVRTYPRTAAVVGFAYAGAIIGAVITGKVMGIPTLRELLTIGALVLVIAFMELITFIWVMSDSRRLAVLLDILNTFEGRGDSNDDCDGSCDLINDEEGQDIAEYAVMLAVMLVIVIGTIRLIGSSAGNVFSDIGSKIGGQ